jgi:hypothetical protein
MAEEMIPQGFEGPGGFMPPGGGPSSTTLAGAYANGLVAADQTLVLLDAKGGAVTVDGTNPGFTGTFAFRVLGREYVSQSLSVGVALPTARLNLPAGTAAASTAPLKVPPGTLLTVPEVGALETDATHIYWTNSVGTRLQLDDVFITLTLAGAYANGTVAADQTLALTDADGGGLIVDGTGIGFTGAYALRVLGNQYVSGAVAIGIDSLIKPTARLHLPAGTAAVGTASLKVDPGILLTVPESGAVESDGTALYWTNGSGTRTAIAGLSAVGTVGFVPIFTSATTIANSFIHQLITPSLFYQLEASIAHHGVKYVTMNDDLSSDSYASFLMRMSTGSSELVKYGPAAPTPYLTTLFNYDNAPLTFATNNIERVFILGNGNVGVGVVSPTARLHLPAGTAAVNTAPLKIPSGVVLAATEAGAVEADASHLYWTNNAGTRLQLDNAAIASTLAATYNAGTVAADQTLVILDAKGGGVLINATTPVLFTGVTAFEVDVIGGSANFFRVGGMQVFSAVSVAAAAGSTWNEIDFANSTLTLTGGPATATKVAMVHVGQGTINGAGNAVTDAYDLLIDAAPTGAATLTRSWSIGAAGAIQAQAGLVLGAGLAPPSENDLVFGAGATSVSAANTGRVGYLAGGTQQLMASANGGIYLPILVGPTASGFSAGSIPFGSATGQLTQDNADLFWDNTNKRLGVDVAAAPTARFHVAGVTAAAGTASIKLNAGTLLAVTEAGAVESDGTNLYWTNSGGFRQQLNNAAVVIPTLAQVYAAGTVAADQTLALSNAAGGGVVVDGSSGGFSGINALAVKGASSGVVAFPRVGGLSTVSSISVVAAPGSVWDAAAFSASALTLTGGPATAVSVAMVHVGQGTVNGAGNTVTDAYNLLADAAPAGTATLTRSWSAGFAGAVQAQAGVVLGAGLAPPGENDLVLGAGATAVSAANTARVGYLAGGTQQLMASLNGGAYVPILVGPAAAGFTQGSVPFGSATGQLTQDNGHFFWNATNATLQLGGAAANATSTLTLSTSKTLASPAPGSVWEGFRVENSTLTAAMGGSPVTVTELGSAHFHQPTITTSGVGALTVTDAYTVRIGAPPVASGSATLTNAWSLGVTGAVRFLSLFLLQPAAVTSGTFTGFTQVAAAHTGLTASTEVPDTNFNLSATKQWATGNITTQRDFLVQARTYAFVGASVVTTGATVAISGPPSAGTNATITNPLALWVQSGVAEFAGNVGVGILQPTARLHLAAVTTTAGTASLKIVAGTLMSVAEQGAVESSGTHLYWTDSTGTRQQLDGGGGTLAVSYALGTVAADQTLALLDAKGGGLVVDGTSGSFSGTNAFKVLGTGSASLTVSRLGGNLAVAQGIVNTGSPTALAVTGGAHTALAAGTEDIGANFNFSATKQWATGAIATQREVVIQAPSYSFTAASTITTAATVAITNAPTASTNATITNPIALWVQGGNTMLSGTLGVGFANAMPDPTVQVAIIGPSSENPSSGATFGTLTILKTSSLFGVSLGIQGDNSTWIQAQNPATALALPIRIQPNGGGLLLNTSVPVANSVFTFDPSVPTATTTAWNAFRMLSGTFNYTGTGTTTATLAVTAFGGGTLTSVNAWTVTDAYALTLPAVTASAPAAITRAWSLRCSSNLQLLGGQQWHTKQVTSTPYTALGPGTSAADCVLMVTNAAATTINLPAISAVGGGWVFIINDSRYNAAVANITLTPNGTDKINNVNANYIMNVSGMSLTLVANATTNNWEFI